MAPTVKNIPVPGVLEVLDYGNRNDIPFCRPNSYISTEYDEVSRALARRTANYDMDSEDELWLEKFNNESFTQNELHQHVSENNFELMVDAFEKANYCSPEDFPDEKAAANLCLDLARSEVVVAVYNYWMKKRKQKRSALVRCFQVKAPLCLRYLISYWQCVTYAKDWQSVYFIYLCFGHGLYYFLVRFVESAFLFVPFYRSIMLLVFL